MSAVVEASAARDAARGLVAEAADARAAGRHRDAERRLQHALDLLEEVPGAAAERATVLDAYVALLVELGRHADAARMAARRG